MIVLPIVPQITFEAHSCDAPSETGIAVFNHLVTYAQIQTVCDALQGELPMARSREEYQGKVYDSVSTVFYTVLNESQVSRYVRE